MERDGVSIVIPNWNHELFLPRSVSSALRGVEALRARGIEAEALVVDDQSRDGSTAMLRQLEALYYDRGLRVHAKAANGGLAAARNTGLDLARHRYVVFMDADNELIPENLFLFRRTLRETEAAAAYGNLLLRDLHDCEARDCVSNRSFQPPIFLPGIGGNYIDAFAMVDRVQVIDAGRYDPSCYAHEDYELWLHLASTGRRLVFVPVAMGYYYVNGTSMLVETKNSDQLDRVFGRIRRIFDQVGARDGLPLETNCVRYHPDLGYL